MLEKSQIIHHEGDVHDLELGDKGAMNDGAARMSRRLARLVAEALRLPEVPSVFQARLGSAKGTWQIDVADTSTDDIWIETYPSQRKWKCDFEDSSHRTFEVQNFSSELKSASLNRQFIPLLEARSRNPMAMRDAVKRHVEIPLRAEIDLYKSGLDKPELLLQQLHRARPASADVHGLARCGGLPDADEDQIIYLLNAGIRPRDSQFLMDKVYKAAQRRATVLRSRINVKIPQSTYAYIIPDFLGVLDENEIHVSFSTQFRATYDDAETMNLETFRDTILDNMDALVARSPAHFPTDIQRVRLVHKHQLHALQNVIVFPTKGKRALADMLSGGDYDGDLAWLCWDQEIVKNFVNVDPASLPPEPDLFSEAKGPLRKMKTTFGDLLDQNMLSSTMSREGAWETTCGDFMHKAFAFTFRESMLGLCSNYKERLCYMGYAFDSVEVTNLCTLLSSLVDASKQGTLFDFGDWMNYLRSIKCPTKLEPAEYEKIKQENRLKAPFHILDDLRFNVVEPVIRAALIDLDQARDIKNVHAYDMDFTGLYKQWDDRFRTDDMARLIVPYLRERIQKLKETWRIRGYTGGAASTKNDFATMVQEMHKEWQEIQPPEGIHPAALKLLNQGEDAQSPWQILKASATFWYGYRDAERFVWYMAAEQLTYIKSRARTRPNGDPVMPMIPSFYMLHKPNNRMIKARVGVADDIMQLDGAED